MCELPLLMADHANLRLTCAAMELPNAVSKLEEVFDEEGSESRPALQHVQGDIFMYDENECERRLFALGFSGQELEMMQSKSQIRESLSEELQSGSYPESLIFISRAVGWVLMDNFLRDTVRCLDNIVLIEGLPNGSMKMYLLRSRSKRLARSVAEVAKPTSTFLVGTLHRTPTRVIVRLPISAQDIKLPYSEIDLIHGATELTILGGPYLTESHLCIATEDEAVALGAFVTRTVRCTPTQGSSGASILYLPRGTCRIDPTVRTRAIPAEYLGTRLHLEGIGNGEWERVSEAMMVQAPRLTGDAHRYSIDKWITMTFPSPRVVIIQNPPLDMVLVKILVDGNDLLVDATVVGQPILVRHSIDIRGYLHKQGPAPNVFDFKTLGCQDNPSTAPTTDLTLTELELPDYVLSGIVFCASLTRNSTLLTCWTEMDNGTRGDICQQVLLHLPTPFGVTGSNGSLRPVNKGVAISKAVFPLRIRVEPSENVLPEDQWVPLFSVVGSEKQSVPLATPADIATGSVLGLAWALRKNTATSVSGRLPIAPEAAAAAAQDPPAPEFQKPAAEPELP